MRFYPWRDETLSFNIGHYSALTFDRLIGSSSPGLRRSGFLIVLWRPFEFAPKRAHDTAHVTMVDAEPLADFAVCFAFAAHG
jgi:hypothetical protein